MSKIMDFLDHAGVFFLATVDSTGQPKVRPLGGRLEMDGKVLFGVGDFKDVYKQLVNEPRVEIAAMRDDGHWLRYTGKAGFETDPKYAAAMIAAANLEDIYNEKTGHKLAVFHLEDATAFDYSLISTGESLL